MSVLVFLLIVLKYIGILLGIILLILITVLGIILFVPVRYSIYLSKFKNIDMDIEVKWFKKLVYYRYIIKNSKKTTKDLKVFGKSLLREEMVEEKVTNQEHESNQDEDKRIKTDTVKNTASDVKRESNVEKVKVEKINAEKVNVEKERNDNSIEKQNTQKSNIIEHHKTVSQGIASIKRESKKIERNVSQEVREQVEEKDTFGIKDILNYPNKKDILMYTYKFIKKLIFHVIPDKFHCEVELGLGDPAETGYILAGIGIIKPYLGNSVNIKGNFDKEVLIGEVRGKGKFLIGIIIKIIIEYLLKKPIRQILSLYLKKRKEDNNGIELEE